MKIIVLEFLRINGKVIILTLDKQISKAIVLQMNTAVETLDVVGRFITTDLIKAHYSEKEIDLTQLKLVEAPVTIEENGLYKSTIKVDNINGDVIELHLIISELK